MGRINVSIDNGVARIELDNPSKLNAISTGMWRAVVDALATFANDPTLRCVVITGQGDKAFCVGADIVEKDGVALESAAEYDRVVIGALQAVQAFPKPTIAMISGYCLGAGVALSNACDLRVAAAGSRFGIPAARLGLAVFQPIIERLTQLVGPSTAKRILFTADRFSAEEALQFGLIDELVAADALAATVAALAARIAANAPLTIVAAKHGIEAVFSATRERDMAACTTLERACIESQDYAEGRRAFLEKRAPVFQGR